MDVKKFVEILGSDYYAGVPDSQLRALCDYLMDTYGIDPLHHVIAANEGNGTALAAGYHLATGKIPVVYMQNSGEGNAVNPVVSLLSSEVYAIPVIFVIGWRGEPGVKDEPQHIHQGRITLKILEDIGVSSYIVSKETAEEEIIAAMEGFRKELAAGRDVAFVVRKGALSYKKKIKYQNGNQLTREEVLRYIVKYSGKDPVVSTTGKTSRELFEIREAGSKEHKYDFLTVGSMGHSSSIALGIAQQKPDTKIWCVDGDGAVLMHMGALALIGANAPKNMIHIVINNSAHETVGGMPTVAGKMDLTAIAKACGYRYAISVDDHRELEKELETVRLRNELALIEVKCAVGSRSDLGRPTTSAVKNKEGFMDYLMKLK